MCWNREEVKRNMEELFPDFNVDKETSTLTANINIVDDKINVEVNSKSLFTLTAEEVELVKIICQCQYDEILEEYSSQKNIDCSEDKKAFDLLNNLLSRIKQWQDEQNTARS